MRSFISIVVMSAGLLAPLSAAIARQSTTPPSRPTPSQPSRPISNYNPVRPSLRATDNDGSRQWNSYIKNLTASRQILAKGWQSMGLSKEQAWAIAKYYDPDATDMTRHRTAADSDPEKSAEKIQAALEAKNYRLANQLLIRYMKSKSGMPDHRFNN